MNIIWHNGEFKDESEAVLTATDRALRGHGVFDTILVIDGRLCNATRHFDRLTHDANILGITIEEEFEEISAALIKENNGESIRYALNTTVTGGIGERGLTAPENPNAQIIMKISSVPEEFPPINAIIAKTVRRNEGSPISRIKSINYGDNILALNEAISAGANEAIMLNNAGNVACATIGNIFLSSGGALYTPPLSDGAMNGITRALLIENHSAQEKTLTHEDLQTADGIYISNSIRGLSAIESLGDAPAPQTDLNIPKDFHE